MFEKMINKKIASVEANKDKDQIHFVFDDESRQGFQVEGDCCSTSWIEHYDVPNDVVGATILSVEELGMGEVKGASENDYDYIQSYQTKFNTNRGTIYLEYRNSSNGYYGGYLVSITK